MKIKIDYQKFKEDVQKLASKIPYGKIGKDGILDPDYCKYKNIYAIPRGGVPVALELTKYIYLPLVEKPDKNSLIVDDLVDSGKTIFPYKNDKAVLYLKPDQKFGPIKNLVYVEKIDGWIEFFYEKTKQDIMGHLERVNEYIKGTLDKGDDLLC